MAGILVVEPFGGLGNRMRVLVSAIHLSYLLKKDLKVIWKIGADFNCPYELLYKPNPLFEILPDHKLTVYSSFNSSTIKRFVINFLNKARGYDVAIWEHDHSQTFFRKDFKAGQLSTYQNIYIRSCEQFYGGDRWDIFQPIDHLSDKIELITKNYGQNTVGVHMRRKDNTKSKEVSTLDSFKQMMREELRINPETYFFISSDDESAVTTLRMEFINHHLITAANHFARDSTRGIQDALVDMHCLSRCNKIIGSYWSSFSEVASSLRGAKLEIAK